MIKLPELFPSDKLNTLDRMQIEWFCAKYTEEFYDEYKFGHFLMAAYAAIPAYLTPDLLYKLWQNFSEYSWNSASEFIHVIAVNDVLLGPFCHEVSYEVYRMEENTRLSFLKWMTSDDPLWASLHARPIIDIADFIETYLDRPNGTMVREGPQYLEEQLMEILVYKDPHYVAKAYLDKLKDALSRNDEQEILSVINNLKKAIKKERYTGYSDENILGNLFGDPELDLWKNVIQQNNAAIAELLELLSEDPKDGNRLQLKKRSNAHAIHVKQTEKMLVDRLDTFVKSENYAIIIGCSNEDIPKCDRIKDILQTVYGKTYWKIKTIKSKTSGNELLRRIATELSAVTAGDNLLICLCAAAPATTLEGVCRIKYHGSHITDQEFGKIINEAQTPASLTLVLDCDGAVMGHWIDTTKPGFALFAANTNELCDVLIRSGGNLSNRRLFVETSMPADQTLALNVQLRSNRKTYYRRFASGGLSEVRLQHNLRLSGYLNKSGAPLWDNETEAALRAFAVDYKFDYKQPNIGELVETRVEINDKEKKPILLFIYSDVQKKLPAMVLEIQTIKAALKNSKISDFTEIKVFQNRPLKEVNDFIKSETSRNRIQFIYFAGFDSNGTPNFPDGGADLFKWSEWVTWQDQLELVVLNTCNSYQLASQLIQIGVRTAIGYNGLVSDADSAVFGGKLVDALANRRPLSSLSLKIG